MQYGIGGKNGNNESVNGNDVVFFQSFVKEEPKKNVKLKTPKKDKFGIDI